MPICLGCFNGTTRCCLPRPPRSKLDAYLRPQGPGPALEHGPRVLRLQTRPELAGLLEALPPRLIVQGGSTGHLYEITSNRTYLLNGLGQRVASTCWNSNVHDAPMGDRFWGMRLALQIREEEVLSWSWWRPEPHDPTRQAHELQALTEEGFRLGVALGANAYLQREARPEALAMTTRAHPDAVPLVNPREPRGNIMCTLGCLHPPQTPCGCQACREGPLAPGPDSLYYPSPQDAVAARVPATR